MYWSPQALQSNGFFFKFQIPFQIIGRKPNFIKRIAMREYWSKYSVLYISIDSS